MRPELVRLWRSPLPDQHEPLILGDHLHPELCGFLRLRTGTGTGDNKIRLGRNRARDLGTERLRLGLGLVAGHAFQRTGEDDCLASDRAITGDGLRILDGQLSHQARQKIAIMRFGEILVERLDDGFANAINAEHVRADGLVGEMFGGGAEGIPAGVGPGQQRGSILANMADAERVQET